MFVTLTVKMKKRNSLSVAFLLSSACCYNLIRFTILALYNFLLCMYVYVCSPSLLHFLKIWVIRGLTKREKSKTNFS